MTLRKAKQESKKKSGAPRVTADPVAAVAGVALVAFLIYSGGLRYPAAVTLSLLTHEAGHLLAARALSVPLSRVRLGVCGLNLRFDYSGASARCEIAVCLAGPVLGAAVSLAAARAGLGNVPGGMYFILSGFVLAGVNLLPVRGLDGGAAFAAFLDSVMLPDRSFRVERAVSAVFTALFCALTAYVGLRGGLNLSMLLLSIWFLTSPDR